VKLIILAVDFVLHSTVVDHKPSKLLEVFISVECLSTLSDFVQELVPFLDVFTKMLKNFTLFNIPKCLVRFPSLKISTGLIKHLLDSGVCNLHI